MKKVVVGIDEVGRGALAGPVVVAAVAVPENLKSKISNLKTRLKDSKKLTALQRESWFKYFKNHPRIYFSLARVYPKTIDRINISRAANLAAMRVFFRLLTTYNLRLQNCHIFLDGGLFIGRKGRFSFAKTITKGDTKITAIKIASIIAKVSRDRLMVRLAKNHSQYGFEKHKGYGTKTHLKALKKHGSSEAHRLSFHYTV